VAARYATVDEVRGLLGPAFDAPAVSDASIQEVIDDQSCLMALSWWGSCLSKGSKYAAAHCVLMDPKNAGILGAGQSGPLASEADGGASRSFAITAQDADDAWWSMTSYGLKYLEHRKAQLGKGVMILGVTSRTVRPYG
jgi:hypothetical protein